MFSHLPASGYGPVGPGAFESGRILLETVETIRPGLHLRPRAVSQLGRGRVRVEIGDLEDCFAVQIELELHPGDVGLIQ